MNFNLKDKMNKKNKKNKFNEQLSGTEKILAFVIFLLLVFFVGWIYADFWFQTIGLVIGFAVCLSIYFFIPNKRLKLILGGLVGSYLLLLGISHQIYNSTSFNESLIIKNSSSPRLINENNSSFDEYYDYTQTKVVYQDSLIDFNDIELIYSSQRFKPNDYIPLQIVEYMAPNLTSFFSLFPYKKIAKVTLDSDLRFKNKLSSLNQLKKTTDEADVGGLEKVATWNNLFVNIGLFLFFGLLVYLGAVIYPKKMIFRKVKAIDGVYRFNKPMWAELVYAICYSLILIFSLWSFFIADFTNEYIENEKNATLLGWISTSFFSLLWLWKISNQIYNINDEIIISNEHIKIKNSGKFKGFKTFTKKEINTVNFSDEYFSINNEEQIEYKSMNIKGYKAQIQKTIETLYSDKTISFVKED